MRMTYAQWMKDTAAFGRSRSKETLAVMMQKLYLWARDCSETEAANRLIMQGLFDFTLFAASLSLHWPEYLMEAGEISLYMFCSCSFATLLQQPASPVRHLFISGIVRTVLVLPCNRPATRALSGSN